MPLKLREVVRGQIVFEKFLDHQDDSFIVQQIQILLLRSSSCASTLIPLYVDNSV